MTLQANQFSARSPLYRLQVGATLAPFGESCIVTTYGQDDESALLSHCALLDLTNLARYGLRGPNARRLPHRAGLPVAAGAQPGAEPDRWQPCAAPVADRVPAARQPARCRQQSAARGRPVAGQRRPVPAAAPGQPRLAGAHRHLPGRGNGQALRRRPQRPGLRHRPGGADLGGAGQRHRRQTCRWARCHACTSSATAPRCSTSGARCSMPCRSSVDSR
jgi:hypothetical protein